MKLELLAAAAVVLGYATCMWLSHNYKTEVFGTIC